MRQISLLVFFCFPLLCLTTKSPAYAQGAPATDAPILPKWEEVPPMDWTNIKIADFADNELDLPYLLHHFHTVANAVVETGENRGFLNLKVNRAPKDNEPYNARVMEGILAFSYFYGVKRPWNPYYNSRAVKQRLEAMLEFWCKIQGPDGRFSEYKTGAYSLAPTGFGVRAMSQTLEILSSGGPTVEPAILERTTAAQRKAIMSLLTLEDNMKAGREYSNQFSGVYQAALSYLKMHPDTEMQTALDAAVKRAVAEHQSPAGFLYEAGAPDFGYSNVHENNLRLAWPYLQEVPSVREPLLAEFDKWHRWLSYNLVLQPDGSGYLANAGVNSRTSHWLQTGTSRPMAELVPSARPFSPTDEEWKAQIAQKRVGLAQNWPNFKELLVPSPNSYDFSGFQNAYRENDSWFATRAQKDEEIAKLPYLASDNFTHVAIDAKPYSFTFVRRPSYYAIFNAGVIRRADFQNYGFGLVWNPKMGGVMQSVADTEWMWGTKAEGAAKVAETKDVRARMTSGVLPVSNQPGETDYPVSSFKAIYGLSGGGVKMVQFDDETIGVTVQRQGAFSEQLPLVKHSGDTLTKAPGRLSLQHGKTTFIVTFAPAVQVDIQPAQAAWKGLERVLVTLKTRDKLNYRLAFQETR